MDLGDPEKSVFKTGLKKRREYEQKARRQVKYNELEVFAFSYFFVVILCYQ